MCWIGLQGKESTDGLLQAMSSGQNGNLADSVSSGPRRVGRRGSPIPEPIQSSARHHNRLTQPLGRREGHVSSPHQENSPTFRRGSFDSRTGQQGYIGSPVQHHNSKKLTSLSSRDHPPLVDDDCDTNYYNDRETTCMGNASRQHVPGTIGSVNVTVDV